EVEEAHGVRTVVRAVACPYTAVVDLRIQSFVCTIGRVNGAYRLARRLFAVLAEHRHEFGLHVGEFAFEVAFHSNPIDGPSLRGFFGPDSGDVVLDAAGDDAGL